MNPAYVENVHENSARRSMSEKDWRARKCASAVIRDQHHRSYEQHGACALTVEDKSATVCSQDCHDQLVRTKKIRRCGVRTASDEICVRYIPPERPLKTSLTTLQSFCRLVLNPDTRIEQEPKARRNSCHMMHSNPRLI